MKNATRTTDRCEPSANGNGHLAAIVGMTDEAVDRMVLQRKQKANYNWSIDPNRSLALAESIIQIGTFLNNKTYIALGKMARGDALKFLRDLPEAWRSLAEARDIYQTIGDEIGWARACIGPLYFCADVNRVDETLENAGKARRIFADHNEQELLVSFDINLGALHISLRNCQDALNVYKSALARAETLGEVGAQYIGRLHLGIGHVHLILGNSREAKNSFDEALRICTERQEKYWMAFTQLNLASLARRQGRYREALRILHLVNDTTAKQFRMLAANANDRIVGCYLFLNRNMEACALAKQVVKEYEELDASYAKGIALFNVATLEAELSDFNAAYIALDAAENILSSYNSSTWKATLHLWRATIDLKTNNYESAYLESVKAEKDFAKNENSVGYSNAVLRQGQALYEMGDFEKAYSATRKALKLAQQCHLAWTQYRSHLLLGQIAETEHNLHRARRHYQAAMTTVERVQRSLSLTLRPGFLENKADGFRAVIRLCFDADEIESAFETLERVKSLAFLSYLNSRDSLRWEVNTPRSQALLEELNSLRDEHQWYYHLVTDSDIQEIESILSNEDVQHKLQACEKQMRAISEQLHIENHDDRFAQHTTPPKLSDIQEQLPEHTVLLEYYNDGESVWVFVINKSQIRVQALNITVAELDGRLQQLQVNINSAVQFGSDNPIVNTLTEMHKRMCGELYTALIQPVHKLIEGRHRLVIVPFGNLHYLPFHLLHSGTDYLIEQHEVVILPTASLITHRSPRQAKGALVIGHSDHGKLPHCVEEAKFVRQFLGGKLYLEEKAQRHLLKSPPCQVLHIAAHGEFRIDIPDLSFIKLEDGQLFTDDLLQHDLGYELITLSGCETGLAEVAANDELIGLGRGSLYAGAGALLVSLWKVDDNSTQQLMEIIYESLNEGLSKAKAVQFAQCQIIARNRTLHPAFWGAFQLIGNGDPLSHNS